MNQAEDIEAVELLLAAEEVEFDDERAANDRSIEAFDEVHAGEHRAASGEEVIDDEDSIGRSEGIDVHVERVGAVFEVISKRLSFIRQLAGFSDGNERGIQGECQRCGEDESASLGSDDHSDATIAKLCGELIGHLLKGGWVRKQRRNVTKHDSRFGKVGDIANVVLEIE